MCRRAGPWRNFEESGWEDPAAGICGAAEHYTPPGLLLRGCPKSPRIHPWVRGTADATAQGRGVPAALEGFLEEAAGELVRRVS